MAPRKARLGVKPIGGSNEMRSRRLARVVTSRYHVLQQQMALVREDKSLSADEKKMKLAELEEELVAAGGVERYQQASVISTQHFQTSKWVLQQLRKLNRLPMNASSLPEDKQLKVLEVGCINGQLHASPLLNTRCIDLNSRLPFVEERDFFTVEPRGEYEVVVCSMVINCVFCPIQRCEMIGRLNMQIRPDGVVFLVLPLRCLSTENIREAEYFESLLKVCGFKFLLPPHTTPRLAFYILGRDDSRVTPEMQVFLDQLSEESKTDKKKGSKTTEPAWSQAVRLFVAGSDDLATKQRFTNPVRRPADFGVQFPPFWLQPLSSNKTKKSTTLTPVDNDVPAKKKQRQQ